MFAYASWASLVFHVDFVNNECDLADFIFICVSNRANINFMFPARTYSIATERVAQL